VKGKTQERMERGNRKRSSGAGSEKMERVSDGQKKMEGYCSTGQSPQQAVVPMEEEDVFVNSPPSSDQDKNEWTYTSTHPICLPGMCRDNFYIYFTCL